MYSRLLSVLLFALVGVILIPTSASAQCCECFEYPFAGLHKCPENPGTPYLNPHFISSDGRCAGFHGHHACGVTEEDAELVAALKKGELIEVADLESLLRRNAEVLSLAKDRSGEK